MPKIRASMKEVSSDFKPIEPGIMRFEIEDVKEITDDGPPERTQYHIKCKVLEVLEDGNKEDVGRTMTEKVHLHLKTGEVNEIGLGQLKRFFEITVGDDLANDEDADTDWLLNKQFKGQVALESYTVENTLTKEKEVRKKSVIKQMAAL